MSQPILSVSRRTRSTPFTSRVNAGGVKGYTVYNHMLLPTVFRDVLADYQHLIEHVQVWDVSAERQVQIKGPDANRLVQLMTPRDISNVGEDQCVYLPLCDEHGCLVNDPVGIKRSKDVWWLSVADSDVLLWAKGLAYAGKYDVAVTEPEVGPIAIQGPKADELMRRVFGSVVDSIRFFRYKELSYQGHDFVVARSGWSKQGGFEVYIDDSAMGQTLWDELFEKGMDLNVGHGCPNWIERVESGLLSFGNDMDYRHTPLQCGLDQYCHLDRDLESMSLPALREQQQAGVPSRLVGVVLPGLPEAPKSPQLYFAEAPVGELTSHTLAGRYDAWLGFAMLDSEVIAQAKTNPAALTMIDGDEQFAPIMTELPFDFSALNLPQR